jgi:hypothetical protein
LAAIPDLLCLDETERVEIEIEIEIEVRTSEVSSTLNPLNFRSLSFPCNRDGVSTQLYWRLWFCTMGAKYR